MLQREGLQKNNLRFKWKYLKINKGVTLKVHAVMHHVCELCKLKGIAHAP